MCRGATHCTSTCKVMSIPLVTKWGYITCKWTHIHGTATVDASVSLFSNLKNLRFPMTRSTVSNLSFILFLSFCKDFDRCRVSVPSDVTRNIYIYRIYALILITCKNSQAYISIFTYIHTCISIPFRLLFFLFHSVISSIPSPRSWNRDRRWPGVSTSHVH